MRDLNKIRMENRKNLKPRMIECQFCSTGKSQKYLYTKCGHLICVNCAALRASDSLECCSTPTKLDRQTKILLGQKKERIINNLQNDYKYEKTDINKIDLIEIQDKLRNIDNLQNRFKRTFQEHTDLDNLNYQTSNSNQMDKTPIDQFYKNPLILNQPKYIFPDSTPIKLVLDPDNQPQIIVKVQAKSGFCPYQQKQIPKSLDESFKQRQTIILNSKFNLILQQKIKQVRNQFKSFYDQIQKLQANILYQIKIYFEEYVNLIGKESFDQLDESVIVLAEAERLDNFLTQFVQEWNLKEIENLFSSKDGLKSKNIIKQTMSQGNTQSVKDKRQMIYCNLIEPVQNCIKKMDNESVQSCIKKLDPANKRFEVKGRNQKLEDRQIKQKFDQKEQFIENLRISQLDYGQKISQGASGRGKNLERIYRKLQESRNKLEQRIQIHNEFMNKRCIKLTSY